jgi:hypothetical protein
MLIITREIPCIVLYNINDKDTTNIVSLQMNVGFIRNSQLYGFNNSSIGKICVAKYEEENGQIIIIQGGIGFAMKICVVFNIIVKKIKLKHPNLTSQILLECISKSGRICSFY